jgi:hypothetical protein
VSVLRVPCLNSKEQFVRAADVSSYGSPSAPPSTSYGIPLAEPLNSYGIPLAEPLNTYGIPLAEPLKSYGIPLAEPLSSYGVPLEEPLNSYGVPLAKALNIYDADRDILDIYSEASDIVDNKVTESDFASDGNQKSSYGSPSAPLSTEVPLAGPLKSIDAAEDIFDLKSEASDNIANKVTESDFTSDRNLKMLMASVPGVPGEDYPILADVLSAGDTGFSCQGKIVGGECLH